ncbi:MAG: RHS repeat domain-containing protein [Blastocatellales bacterium]
MNKYVYDADGKRVRRQVGAQQFWQVYGIDGELIAEYEWNGTTASLQKEYGSGGGASVVAEGATVRWLVTDHLGTPRMIADQTGSLSGMRRHDYLPFGEENFTGATIRTAVNGYQAEGVRQKFTGYERDTETDLDFAEARYHSAKQGRFTSPDPLLSSANPIEPQSWNRYSYVGNRPLIYTDPSGLRWFYNKKTNEYGWCDCNQLGQGDIDAGWTEITRDHPGFVRQFANGDVLYTSAAGALILLPGNSSKWDNLTARIMAEERFREIAKAKNNAEEWANAILLDFITKSVEGGLFVASGGSVTLIAAAVEAAVQLELFDPATWQGPIEPYNRQKHYGTTPTPADREFFAPDSPDHIPTLVERYYDGDPSTGRPGYAMTPEERRASATDRNMMQPSNDHDQRVQGGKSKISKDRLKKLRGKY